MYTSAPVPVWKHEPDRTNSAPGPAFQTIAQVIPHFPKSKPLTGVSQSNLCIKLPFIPTTTCTSKLSARISYVAFNDREPFEKRTRARSALEIVHVKRACSLPRLKGSVGLFAAKKASVLLNDVYKTGQRFEEMPDQHGWDVLWTVEACFSAWTVRKCYGLFGCGCLRPRGKGGAVCFSGDTWDRGFPTLTSIDLFFFNRTILFS